MHYIWKKNKYFGPVILHDRRVNTWRLTMIQKNKIIEEFEAVIEKVEYSFASKKFLLSVKQLLRELGYPRSIQMSEAEHYFNFEFETPEGGYESILSLLVLAYNNNRDLLLKQMIFIIDWHLKLGKAISIDVLLDVLGECSISEHVGLTSEQQQVCDFIARHPDRTEKEVFQLFNDSRSMMGRKQISMPTFINHVRALKAKLRFNIIPGFDYYRLGLFPMMIKMWISKPFSAVNPAIVHPYIRYTSVLFEDRFKRLLQIGIVPPRTHVKHLIQNLKENPYIENFQAYCYHSVTDGLNARYISRIAHSWEVNEKNIEGLLSHTPLDYVSDQYLILPRTFEYWHDWVDFEQERGKRLIPITYEKLLIIHGLWKSVGHSKKLKVSPYSVIKLYKEDGIRLSYKRVVRIVRELEKQKVIRWKHFARLFSTQILTIFVENPSEEVEFLLKSSLNYLPQYALLHTYEYEKPRNKQLLIEINVPKATSMPVIYSSFLRKHRRELDDFIVARTVRRTHAQLPLYSLWDIENNQWEWDTKTALEIAPMG